MSKVKVGQEQQKAQELSAPEVTSAMIPLGLILADKERNVREDYREIEQLAESIRVDGQQMPIEVVPEGDKYRLVSGYRRYMAAKKLGLGVLRAEIKRGLGSAEVDWHNVLENVHRLGLNDFETAKGFVRQNEQYKWTGAEIARRLGMGEDGKSRLSPSHINNLMRAVRSLIPEALKAWSKGQIGSTAAFVLASRKGEEQTALLPKVKGRSGAALGEAVEAFDNPETDESDTEENENATQTETRRPGKSAMKKAIAWAKEKEMDEVAAALKWALGVIKNLEIDGHKFSAKPAKPAQE